MTSIALPLVPLLVLLELVFMPLIKIGNHFPNENELLYESGYLKSYRHMYYLSCGKRRNCDRELVEYAMPILVQNPNSAHGHEYFCDYGDTHKDGRCFNSRYLPDEYKNQPAKIGYYIQPDFLWYHAPYRQLVTLEINGKTVRSYQDTVNLIEQRKKTEWLLIMIFTALFGVVLLFVAIVAFIEIHHKNDNHSP
ncbi:hypothetical protein [Moraxella oblonga]|uniref:hypothetical protein n=1 Tax=Moraxella oblonga TaxID=200413 RepID=UPI00083384E1|nr:hypothetical protein [Moraxella oblonga]